MINLRALKFEFTFQVSVAGQEHESNSAVIKTDRKQSAGVKEKG
jgi:hypothetical protein